MSSVGEQFPRKKRKEYAERIVELGAVIRTQVKDTDPPKYKRFILVAYDIANNEFATVYINSEINDQIFPTKELKDLHIKLDPNSAKYINKTSFIDCSELHCKKKPDIVQAVIEDTSAHLGHVEDQILSKIQSTAANAPTISAVLKDKFLR